MTEPEEKNYFDAPELEFSEFPHFWYRCFSKEFEDSPEYIFRNFVAQAAYIALKGKRPPELRALLTINPDQLVKSFVLKRSKANFPNKEFDELIEKMERERKKEMAKKYTDPDNYSVNRVRHLLREQKLLRKKREEFANRQLKIRQLSKMPEYILFIKKALLGELDPNSNIARQGAMFILGFWFVMIEELVEKQTGENLTEVSLRLFDRIVGKRLKDEKERIIVREAIRGSIEILLFFGRYILDLFKVCLFCNYKPHMPGSSKIDENLLYLLPSTKLVNWIGINRTDTINQKLPEKIFEIFPLKGFEKEITTAADLERFEKEISPRRLIGIATRENKRYRLLATELMRIIRMETVNGKPPHLNGMYLDRVFHYLSPYLVLFPTL